MWLLKSIFYTIVYIIYKIISIILSLFTNNNEKNNYTYIKIDNKKIEELKIYINNIEDENLKTKNKLYNIVKKIENRNTNTKEIEEIKKEIIKLNIKEEQKIIEYLDEIKTNIDNKLIENKQEEFIENKKNIEKDNKKIEEKSIKTKKDKFMEFIIISTKIIKENEKKLTNLKEKEKYMKTIDYVYEINKLKKELEEIEKQYINIKKDTSYLEILKYNIEDPYELKFDTIKLKKIINKLKEEIKPKEEVKKTNKIETKEIKEIKKIEKKEEDKKVKTIDEYDYSNNLIQKDILKYENEYKIIEEKVSKIGNKEIKKVKTNFIFKLLTNAYNVGISLFPFHIFRNKLLGITTSMILINNNIRKSRSILNNKNINLINKYNLNLNIMINDTLNQINNLRMEMILNNYYDMRIFNKLDSIENYISKYQIKQHKKENNKIKKLSKSA